MEDIKAILAKHEGIDAETAQAIESAVLENYRTKAETDQKAERIKALEAQNAELSDAVKKAQADGEGSAEAMQALQAKVKEFEEAENARKAKADDDAARAKFADEFAAELGERKFANSVVEDAVTEAAYQLRKANPDMSAKDILAQAAPDEAGIWENPQQPPHPMQTGSGSDLSTVTSLEQVKNMSADEINKNWDAISKLLASQK